MSTDTHSSAPSFHGFAFRSERSAARSRRRVPVTLEIFGVVALLCTAALTTFAALGGSSHNTWSNLIDNVGMCFALAGSIHATRRTTGDMRSMWLLITLGVGCWIAGEAIFDFRLLALGTDPNVAVSNVLYLAFYPLMIAGLIVRDRDARTGGWDIRFLDAIVVALAIAVVAYGLVYDNPLDSSAQPIDGFARVAYPLLDGLLIWAVAYQLYSRRIVWDVTRTLLGAAVFAMFAATLLWSLVGQLESGIAMSLSMTCIGFAALASPEETRVHDSLDHPRRTVVPEAVLLVSYLGVAAVLFNRFYDSHRTLVVLACAALLVLVVRMITALAQNERLLEISERRASTDALTGLANRQNFHERLDAEISRTSREGDSFALLLIDLDSFKSINDIAGHRAGDRVLIEVANTMRNASREFDVVCRIGGDELAIIAPHANASAALDVAERLCGAAKRISLREFTDLPPISVSIGCCVYPMQAADAAELIDHADAALYRVKQNRRGFAGLYSPEEQSPADAGWELARVRAELAARDADFQAVFRHAHEAMAIFDDEGVLLMVNDVTTRLFGTTRERMVGHHLSDFVKPESVAGFKGLLPRLTAEGALEGRVEVDLANPDGSGPHRATLEYSTARFSPNRFLSIMWDVTAEDRAAAELAESERRFRAVFESSLDAIFVTDDSGTVRDANPAAARLTGRSLPDLIGKPVEELVHPEDMGEVIEQRDGLRDVQTARGTFTTRDEFGTLRTVEYSAVADFVPGLHLSIVREVSDRFRATAGEIS